jgi:hypothetical protein
MSSLDPATRSLDAPERDRKQRERQAEDAVANDNANERIEIWPEGDPQLFARALARVLARHALQECGALAAEELHLPTAVAG